MLTKLCLCGIRQMTDSRLVRRPYASLVSSKGTDGAITTIVFADVEGSTALVDRVGDHAGTAAVLQQLAQVRARVEPYGGREVKSLGDGLMLTFVSPRQAVGFALATQRALAGTSPRVRFGINTGEVFDAASDPIGGAVNAAARIAGRAEGGEVLVSDVVRQLVGLVPAIRFADRGRLRLKGFSERWHLWAAEDSAGVTITTGTVGRVTELQQLRDLIAATVTGNGQAIVLEGEAGIGKTHLVRNATAMARDAGVAVIEVVADEVMRRPGTLAHGLLDDVRVGGSHRARLRELLQRTTRSGEAEDLSYAIVEASVDAVESMTRDGATLVIVEDAHWADDLSLSVLRSLVRRASVAQFCVIISMRPSPRSPLLDRLVELVVDGRGRHLRLSALDDIDVHALSSAITGAAPGQELRGRLRATAGNPLFVTELLRSFDDEGLLRIDSGIADVAPSVMPRGLNETLVRRLSWLPGETRELLRLSSVLGTSFTLADLATVTGRAVIDVAAWLREASLAGLIIGDGDRLTFRHDLIREAVYGHMLAAERRDLHRAAAQALAVAGAPTQQVARQFARGALPGDLEAVTWLERAADETISIAPSAAIMLYEEVLALADEFWPGRAAVQARMIEPLAWCGRFQRAQEMADTVLASSPGVDVEFAALRGMSAVHGNRGDIVAAIATLERAIAVPDAPVVECDRLVCATAQLQVLTGAIDAVEARRIGNETLTNAEASGDLTAQCVALQVLAATDSITGYGGEACDRLRRAIALYDSGRVTRASYLAPATFYAGGLLDLDDVDGAREAAAEARAHFERRGALSQIPFAYVIAGAAHYYTGRFDDAIAEIEAGLAVIDDTGSLNFVLYHHALGARIAIQRGDLAEAQKQLTTATTFVTSGPSLFGVDWLFDTQAQYLATMGDFDGALNIAEVVWAQTESIRYFFGHRERGVFLARLAHTRGRDRLAEEVTASLEEGSRRSPATSASASAMQSRGIIDDNPAKLLEAVDLFRLTPLRPALAICCEDAAVVHADQGQPDQAVALLDEAAAIYSDIGAHGGATRVDETLRALGVRPRKARAHRPTFGWESLTPMEISVSELVSEGLTNPEIGARLYISRRTVETHLAHVFRKLGYASRSQLAAELTRRTQNS
jgi:class 3 adenylate cyclase/DNA-binding CsgD family transcriptional regulator